VVELEGNQTHSMSLRDFMKIEQEVSNISAMKDRTHIMGGEQDDFDPLV
jgi:hypothetical protein